MVFDFETHVINALKELDTEIKEVRQIDIPELRVEIVALNTEQRGRFSFKTAAIGAVPGVILALAALITAT